MKGKRKRGVEIGLIFWIVSMLIITAVTVYKYVQVKLENERLWKEYRRLEQRLEDVKDELEMMEGGGWRGSR